MKVNLITKKSIIEFIKKNSQAKKPFTTFLQKIKKADWDDIKDVQGTFKSASIICEGQRIVFRLASYRIICGFKKTKKRISLYVKFIGTHSEYDKVSDAKRQCTISNY